ncbi:type II toxin-antitoxin system PrlF family antitoxin [Candidatus Babeliales bacterium]|nr:type II toxin-antitoxin system PrlF family antitoxin [Candidatus Babeliales bacterium]MCF7899322.1 type II toxin-antitoxin system PrlF family antitoxin [Candidatus Babeliales bacterium]
MKYSKLTSKYQATIPKEIREKLKLSSGDTIVFEISDKEAGTVIIKKVSAADSVYLRALNTTLNEWESKEDEECFKHLQDI